MGDRVCSAITTKPKLPSLTSDLTLGADQLIADDWIWNEI